MNFNLENFKLSIEKLYIGKKSLIVICLGLCASIYYEFNIVDYVKVNYLKKPVVKRDYISESIDIDPLDDLTQELCDNYGCSYVNVNLFHNGTTSSSGYKCKKMSCFSEGLDYNRHSLMQALQNQVIEPFKLKFRAVKKDGYYYVKDLRLDKDPYFRNRMPQYGMTSIYYVAIYDKRYIDKYGKWHFKGFISYAWDHETDFPKDKLIAMRLEVERVIPIVIKK